MWARTSCVVPWGLRTTTSLYQSATTALPSGKEPTGLDELEDVVARVGPVAVHRLLCDGEGRLDLGRAHVLDDPHARAV